MISHGRLAGRFLNPDQGWSLSPPFGGQAFGVAPRRHELVPDRLQALFWEARRATPADAVRADVAQAAKGAARATRSR
jgi:hypothetical protein